MAGFERENGAPSEGIGIRRTPLPRHADVVGRIYDLVTRGSFEVLYGNRAEGAASFWKALDVMADEAPFLPYLGQPLGTILDFCDEHREAGPPGAALRAVENRARLFREQLTKSQEAP